MLAHKVLINFTTTLYAECHKILNLIQNGILVKVYLRKIQQEPLYQKCTALYVMKPKSAQLNSAKLC